MESSETEYVLRLSAHDLGVLDQLLQAAPYRVSAPLIEKLNRQLSEQKPDERRQA